MAAKPFPAYEGADPYFFVSYAHEDSDVVFPEMAWIDRTGFNLWYDDGIHVGSVWRSALADSLSKSAGLIFFATEKSVESNNCLKELNFVLDEEKPVFVVQLDDTPLPSLLRLALSDRQALRRSEFDEETFRSRLVTALSTVVSIEDAEAATKTELPTIAVLPFTNLSKDEEMGFLAESLGEDIAVRMASSPFSIVTEQHADAELAPHEIGQRRHVRYVLSGSLTKSGDRVRATARLTETSEGKQVWANRYDFTGEDWFEIQDQLAIPIVADAATALHDIERARFRNVPVEELDAWGLMTLAEGVLVRDRGTRDEMLTLMRRAVVLDPSLAFAHAFLANGLTNLVVRQFTRDVDAYAAEATTQADQALTLAPNEIYVLNICSYVQRVLGNETLALELARRPVAVMDGNTSLLYPALIANGQAHEVLELAVLVIQGRIRGTSASPA